MKPEHFTQWFGLALIAAGMFTVWVWRYWLGFAVTGFLLVVEGALTEADRRRGKGR